ncbi:MAG: hypothetical protein M3H12_12560 [Chromatiales bacterium]|nr:hypothetical protein [Gammaproteobacteria bacterium]
MKNVLGLICLVAMDNNIPMKPFEEIQWPKDVDWEKLDQDAAKLSIPEAETFCNGELQEAQAISDKYGLHLLSNTLNDIFDGHLYDVFYYS